MPLSQEQELIGQCTLKIQELFGCMEIAFRKAETGVIYLDGYEELLSCPGALVSWDGIIGFLHAASLAGPGHVNITKSEHFILGEVYFNTVADLVSAINAVTPEKAKRIIPTALTQAVHKPLSGHETGQYPDK